MFKKDIMPMCAIILFVASSACASIHPVNTKIHNKLTYTSSPPPSQAPTPKPVPPQVALAAGQMAQYDITPFIITVPADVTKQNPTSNGITYPPEAIDYGLWFNESLLASQVPVVGSLFNSPVSVAMSKPPPGAEWYRALQRRLYNMTSATSPILYGMDNVHGVNYAFGATLFPQPIGIAASFDRSAAFNMGNVTARESRYIGIPWSFAPVLGIAVQPAWPRVYETFGEDPMLAAEMAKHDITAMQQPPPPAMFPDLCRGSGNASSATCPQAMTAACMKHFIGYSDSRTGRDRTPAWIPDNILMQYFVPPFKAAIDAGVLSAMENYIQLNGRPVVSSKLYLQYLLRTVLKFTGLLTTDYNEIYELRDFHNATGSYRESVLVAINQTTIDMGMFGTPFGWSSITEHITELWQDDKISTDRLSASLTRIAALKAAVGLHSDPVPPVQTMPLDSYNTYDSTPIGQTCFFGCPEHHAAALDAALKSMTLLENDGILPLPSSNRSMRLAVIGEGCNSVPIMAGGWTIHWQGSTDASDFPYGTTLLDELAARFDNVTYAKGCSLIEESSCAADVIQQAVDVARAAQVAIICVGEAPYAEVLGDIHDLTLPGEQIAMVEAVAAVQPNIVTVLIEGRPRVLGTIPDASRAVMMAYLPGPFGGKAIADTLLGLHSPSGRLPITYPRRLSSGPVQYWRAYDANEFDDYYGQIQWPFGHGKSYTRFAYTSLHIGQSATAANYFKVSVNVTNVGTVAASEVVLLFTTQAPRPMPAEVKRLRNFTRVAMLQPGETQTVELLFNILSLTFYDEVSCEWLAFRPTYVTVGSSDPFVEDGLTVQLDLGNADSLGWVGCPLSAWYREMDWSSSFITPTAPPPAPQGEAQDYFMSSVVCFVGGVIATCFLVFFVRKRNRYMRTEVPLFEPSGV